MVRKTSFRKSTLEGSAGSLSASQVMHIGKAQKHAQPASFSLRPGPSHPTSILLFFFRTGAAAAQTGKLMLSATRLFTLPLLSPPQF